MSAVIRVSADVRNLYFTCLESAAFPDRQIARCAGCLPADGADETRTGSLSERNCFLPNDLFRVNELT